MFIGLWRTIFSKMLLVIASAGVQDRKPKISRVRRRYLRVVRHEKKISHNERKGHEESEPD
jgi:hypothetical protein